MNERETLVAACGIDCGICEMYTCRNDEKIYNYLISRGIPKEKIPCDGCRNISGKCPVIPEECETYICVESKNVEFCSDCSDFPCSKLMPSSKMADVLPHNMKVFNLCTIKRDGVSAFTNKSQTIKDTYYNGKMEIGKGPKK